MTVLELLEELEEIIGAAPKLPLTGKVMVDASEILDMAKEIRLALPDDVQQAKWIKDEKERILSDARTEYEKIIIEAKKQADTMVERDVITTRAVEVSGEIRKRADNYSRTMTLRTYDYMDEVLEGFQDKLNQLNNKYFGQLYDEMEKHFNLIGEKVQGDIGELRKMREETKNAPMPEHNIEIPVNDISSAEEE